MPAQVKDLSYTPPLLADEGQPRSVLQQGAGPISEQELVDEVRSIYAGLIMVEKRCIDIDSHQASFHKAFSDDQWQALIDLQRTLLREHHDFVLASQHPSASSQLQNLARKYVMPARMWRHQVHHFLELLRHRLPDSLDDMLTFIYTAYPMVALLMEMAPRFQDTWIECLGDLARYRMAIEDNNVLDRETWSTVTKFWYKKPAGMGHSVRVCRILEILSRSHLVQPLLYYGRSLPFPAVLGPSAIGSNDHDTKMADEGTFMPPPASTSATYADSSPSTSLLRRLVPSLPFSLLVPLSTLVPLTAAFPVNASQGETTRASSPDNLGVDDICLIILCMLVVPVSFGIGRKFGHPRTFGTFMVVFNITTLITSGDPLTTAVGHWIGLGLSFTFTAIFAGLLAHRFRHITRSVGHTIFFLFEVGLVYYILNQATPTPAVSIGREQGDSAAQFVLPSVAFSLICWWKLAEWLAQGVSASSPATVALVRM